MEFFNISLDINLDVMCIDQDLSGTAARLINGIDSNLKKEQTDVVIVQGDTHTAFYGALVSFYKKIPIAHVEAGLRTNNKFSPFPEEINRRLISQMADWHFCSTINGRNTLISEKINNLNNRILVTGNTIIDALLHTCQKLRCISLQNPGIKRIKELLTVNKDLRLILVTGHRRENFGYPIEEICKAIDDIAKNINDVLVVYPVHPNPNVINPVESILGKIDNVILLPPLEYQEFVTLMQLATLIISDSGGVQEEAPFLGKPVLVTRDNTERPEAIESGCAKLVGTDRNMIFQECKMLLDDINMFNKMSQKKSPFGDGKASYRILESLKGNKIQEFSNQ